MSVQLVKHPLVAHKLGLLREHDISTKVFRELANEIAMMLMYEATRDLPTEEVTIRCWSGDVRVRRISGKFLTLVPILRAGLGMLDGCLTLIPGAKVSVVGMYRDEKSLKPQKYYAKLAKGIENRRAIIIDPMLATGGSAAATASLLKQAGCTRICGLFLVAAPEGVAKLQSDHPDVDIFLAGLDKGLNADGFILDGLGDAGDKITGTK